MPPVGESRASRARGSISAWPLPSPTYPHAVGPGASLAEVFEAAGASLCIVGALNLSLMWIEFVLATKRLERLSNNLRLTKKILVGYMIGFCALEVILITLQIVVSGAFYNLTMGLSLITAILIIITFLVGASKLNKVYGKAAATERASASTMQTSATMQVGQTQEEEAAAYSRHKLYL